MDLERGAGPAGIAQVVGRSQLGEQIEAALALERLEQFYQPRRRHEQPQVVAKPRLLKTPSPRAGMSRSVGEVSAA